MSKLIPINYNTRNQNIILNHIVTSEKSSRVHRVKRFTPNHSIITSSTKNMNSNRLVVPPTGEEKIHEEPEFEIKPTIKKTCARCKESNKCVKLLCSKINRLEELVKNIAESTKDGLISTNNNNNNITQPSSPIPPFFMSQPQLLTPISSPIQNFSSLSNSTNNSQITPTIPITTTPTFNNDFSNHSLEDLQKIVMILTNTMISNKEGYVPVIRPNALHTFNHHFQ